VVSDRELEDRPYQPLRATGHGDANGLMSANGGPWTLAITGGCR